MKICKSIFKDLLRLVAFNSVFFCKINKSLWLTFSFKHSRICLLVQVSRSGCCCYVDWLHCAVDNVFLNVRGKVYNSVFYLLGCR